MIEFEVIGLPAPQGSKKHVGNGIMVETSPNLKPWRSALSQAARDVSKEVGMLDEPLTLEVSFRFPMPKSRKKAVREAGWGPKVSAPDLDKLLRSVGDGLQEGGLIRNDALICRITASKMEVIGWTGAIIRLSSAVPPT